VASKHVGFYHDFAPAPVADEGTSDPRLCDFNVCRRGHPHPEPWPCVCKCHAPVADGGEILTRANVEQALGAMGDPEWFLTDSYRTLLLAHDAALRAEVERLNGWREGAFQILAEFDAIHPFHPDLALYLRVRLLIQSLDAATRDGQRMAKLLDDEEKENERLTAALDAATRALREVRALDFTESNRISDSALAQIEGARK
jgi:hypothetical protein